MITNLFWFFFGLAGLMALQLFLSARQAQRFMRTVRALRARGTVGIGLGSRRWYGRRAYVALAADPAGVVVDAVVLRGITQFARPRPLPEVVGQAVATLAQDDAPAGGGRRGAATRAITRSATRQAAQTLNTSDRLQPAGGVDGKEGAPRTSSLVQ